MPSFTRREFLKKTLGIGTAAAVSSQFLFSSKPQAIQTELKDRLFSSPYSFGYDPECFAASERIFFEGYNRAYLNVFVKPGKTMDINIYTAGSLMGLSQGQPLRFTGVKDSFDIFLGHVNNSELFYRLEYKDHRYWRSHDPRNVKTPNIDLESGGKIKVILKGDDHVYADLKHEPEDEIWRRDMLSGDYITNMLKKIMIDPNYTPELGLQKVVYGFTLAHTLKYILESKPDLVIDLGDTVGPDSYGVWGGKGQWPELQPEDNYAVQSKILWERKRRTLSTILPEVPYYLALGNHDGEVNWYTESYPFTQPYARWQRKRLFRQPSLLRYPERLMVSMNWAKSGLFKNPDQNYFPLLWAKGDVRFLLLDVNSYLDKKPESISDWTLGEEQKLWAEKILLDGYEAPWKFICYHNTLGGYPLGSKKGQGAYGRGPLFTREDFEKIHDIDPNLHIDPETVEQVWLTDLALDSNVRGFFYAHDHIFFKRDVGKTTSGKDMIGVCAGGTTYSGGLLPVNIWDNPYWMAYYGPYFEDPPPFLTPPGLTELEIDKNGAKIKYVCTAPPESMHSNMLPGTQPGDILREYQLAK